MLKLILPCILALALLAGPLLSQAQAQPGGGALPEADHDTVPIVLWTSEIPKDRLAVIHYLTDVFTVMNGIYEVEVKSVNENELVERLAEVHGTDEAPHLIGTGSELIGALGEKGLLDTTLTGKILRQIGRNRFFSGALSQLSMPGNRGYYGIPYHGWVQGIWYRADWFEQARLDPPTTWDAILKAAQHFTDPQKGTYGILIGTDSDQYAEQVFTQLAMSNNARMFGPDGSLRFNTPAMVDTLDFYAQLAKYTPPGPQSWRARDYYMQGKMAMFFYSTFIMDDLALKGVAANSLTRDNFGDLKGAAFDPDLARNTRLAPFVTHRSKAGYGMINGFAPVKGTPLRQVQGVRALLEFLYEPVQYVEWMHMAPGGMLPAVRDIAASERFMRDPLGVFRRYGRPKVREILSGLENIRNFGLVDGRRFPMASVFYAERIIPRMIEKAVHQGLAPKFAVAWAEEEMHRTMARQKTPQQFEK